MSNRLNIGNKLKLSAILFLLTGIFTQILEASDNQSASSEQQTTKTIPSFQTSEALPALLTSKEGILIESKQQWEQVRRPELMQIFSEQMYGCTPENESIQITHTLIESSTNALEGLATRKQITLTFKNQDRQTDVDLLLYFPNSAYKQPVPLIIGLNFKGNQAIAFDPEIKICDKKMQLTPQEEKGPFPRGSASSRWPLKLILEKGYAVATMARGDIALDSKNDMNNNILSLFPELQQRDDNFSTIGAWAWTLSRAVDYLEKQPELDSSKISVIGHSRLGKTALWAGALDPRFSVIISNESGAGGAALTRRMVGETIADLCRNFPYWFCKNFQKYAGYDKVIPFDQHQLIALIAPRHVYVASAQEDKWADPEGEFTSLKLANPVFKLYGINNALPAEKMPEIGHPLFGHNAYHIRPGKHNITEYDWKNFLEFLDICFKREKTPAS